MQIMQPFISAVLVRAASNSRKLKRDFSYGILPNANIEAERSGYKFAKTVPGQSCMRYYATMTIDDQGRSDWWIIAAFIERSGQRAPRA